MNVQKDHLDLSRNNWQKAKLLAHLKISINLIYLENGTYDQIVAYLTPELKLSGMSVCSKSRTNIGPRSDNGTLILQLLAVTLEPTDENFDFLSISCKWPINRIPYNTYNTKQRQHM